MVSRGQQQRGRADGRPDYIRVADDIRTKITNGTEGYRVNDYLPSFAQQATQEGVAVATIQKAIGVLRTEGYVESAAGQGTWVISTDPDTQDEAGEIARKLQDVIDQVATLTGIVTTLQNRVDALDARRTRQARSTDG